MSQRSSTPLEVTPLPEIKPRKSWVPFIMGSILAGSAVMAVVFGIWGFIRLIESIDGPGSMASAWGDEWQAAAEKQAEFRATFRIPTVLLPDADLPVIEKVLTKYVAAAKFNDHGAIARLVDVEAFLQRMQEHPDMPRLEVLGRKALLTELNRSLQLPSDVTGCRLMGFKRLTKGVVIADVILKHSPGSSQPFRLWLQQRGRAWSVVDWEAVSEGKSESAQWAGAQRTSQDYLGSMYAASIDAMRQADDRFSRGDVSGAVQVLGTADQRSLPSYLSKQVQLAVATRFHRYGQHQSALDCLTSMEFQDQVPGVFVIQALCYQALGEPAKAIESAMHYEQLCGFSPDVVRAKALSLIQLEKKDEATAEFQRLLEFDPTDQAASMQLAALRPAGEQPKVPEPKE